LRALKVAQPTREIGRNYVKLVVPLRTAPGLNAREHWAKRAKRVKNERNTVRLFWRMPWAQWVAGQMPFVVVLTRVSPKLADDDNVVGALKHCRDEVASILGVGDSPADPVQWFYSQRQGPWAVEIEVRWSSHQEEKASK
jgi:hypothetical protein